MPRGLKKADWAVGFLFMNDRVDYADSVLPYEIPLVFVGLERATLSQRKFSLQENFLLLRKYNAKKLFPFSRGAKVAAMDLKSMRL
jgi:hypothetical protein